MSTSYRLYQQMKVLAQDKRQLYVIHAIPLDLVVIRKIYKKEGIYIKLCKGKLRNLRAAYHSDDYGCDVLLNDNMPREAKIFSLCHELKHHYIDRDLLAGAIPCLMAYGLEPETEIAAEVFAAEFIWPEENFKTAATAFNIDPRTCTKETIVYFKKASGMPVSYTFIRKRLDRLGYIPHGAFTNVKFKNLEIELFGTPFYLRNR